MGWLVCGVMDENERKICGQKVKTRVNYPFGRNDRPRRVRICPIHGIVSVLEYRER